MKSPLRNSVLDTNLLLLWLVARTDVHLLKTFKRVQAFTFGDVQLLEDVLSAYPHQLTTPHVLAETSNFVNQAPAWRRQQLIDELRMFVQDSVEIYKDARSIAAREEFSLLGLTDTGMAQLSSGAMVITVDFRLAGKIEATGGNAINFNHYRSGFLRSHRT